MSVVKYRLTYIMSLLGGMSLAFSVTNVTAEEVKAGTLYGNMQTVTQDMLDVAAGDAGSGNITELGPGANLYFNL